MARLPDDWIERIKRDISIESLVTQAGITLKRHGSNLVGTCPFHDDRTPSLVITPSKNLWHCLGACDAGGSPIDWVMRSESISFREACDKLRERHLPQLKQPEPREISMNLDAEDHELLNQVVDFYHATLKDNRDGLSYLEKRGIRSQEALTRFRLGLSNRTLGLALPSSDLARGRKLRKRLVQIGVLLPGGHERFNGALVFPVIDEAGQVTEIYGRKFRKSIQVGSPRHVYLPGPHRGIWNPAALIAKEVILCESILDALTFWEHGFHHVTTSYGANGFTDDLMSAFKSKNTERVLIAYDSDEAGNKAAETVAHRLIEHGMAVARVRFPQGMDANEYALQEEPAQQSLAYLLQHTERMGGPIRSVIPMPLKPLVSPLAAEVSSLPERATKEEKAAGNPDEMSLCFGPRAYRVRGLARNLSYDQLRISLRVTQDPYFHLDSLDLCSARQRNAFIKAASTELGVTDSVIKTDLSRILLKLEERQDQNIQTALKPQVEEVELTSAEREEAMQLLMDPKLMDRICEDYAQAGLVGEDANKLVGYLAAVSRKLDRPLAIVVQSSSAAGKSALMDGVLRFMPDEEVIKYSAMTGQSLFYMGGKDLKHKILAVAEEEGAERASYSLKLLQSEGELTIASTGKDPKTGKMETREYHVEGPVMILLTTTAVELDEELLNRCLVLTVNEGRDQTQAIHVIQRERETLEGFLEARLATKRVHIHQNAQRLLEPIQVFNPYAKELTFRSDRTRMRRDHPKYLTLIKAVTLLHQFQRPKGEVEIDGDIVPYLEVTLEDIANANRLAHEVLGRTLDELAPQSRNLLLILNQMVASIAKEQAMKPSDVRFTRKDVRDHSGWSDYQVKAHMRILHDLEYVFASYGGRGQNYVYELLYSGEGQAGDPFCMTLIDPLQLEEKEHASKRLEHPTSGIGGVKEGPSRPQDGPMEPSQKRSQPM